MRIRASRTRGTSGTEQVMSDIKSRLKSVADREKWAARRASLVGKAKATKVVWFPPKPVEAGKKAASTAKGQTTRATKKSTGAAKKSTGAAKKSTGAAKKSTGAAKKSTTEGTKKLANRPRRKAASSTKRG
jgi:hypothetical protein